MSAAAPCTQTDFGIATRSGNVAAVVLRYVLSSTGPVCISAAHFVAALLFLHAFTRAEFGLFSFLLVVVPFCLSIAGAMIGAPAAVAVRNGSMGTAELATYLKTNLALGAAAGLCVFALVLLSGAGWMFAFFSGAYAATTTVRWFARTLAYARGPAWRVLLSDMLYSSLLVAALLIARHFDRLTPVGATEVLFLSCLLAWLSFGRSFLREQIGAAFTGSLFCYARIWNAFARWSALGVVLTEFTANAHAYLVTFIAGPAAFAPLAIGALLMRPVQLVLAAIPDRERPAMARLLGSREFAGARCSVNHFRIAAGAVWLLTATAAAVLLLWFPQLILRKGYDPSQALTVLGFFAAITLVRSIRTPESVFLQAAGEFRALALASFWSAIVSLLATLALLVVVGPVFSLMGILAGEVVVTARVHLIAKAWMRSRA